MNLQETLDALKRNDRNQLYRKDRQVVFRTDAVEDFRVGLVNLDDEGTIVVELVPDTESGEAALAADDEELASGRRTAEQEIESLLAENERLSMAFANQELGD